MTHHRNSAKTFRSVRLLAACAAFLLLQACSEPLSIVNEVLRDQDQRRSDTPVEVESQVTRSDDGHVSASGPVQSVANVSFKVADATFRVTGQTTFSDAENQSMSLAEISVGSYVAVEGIVADDGSFEAVSVQEDHTVLVCHVPPGNPDHAHTISVGERAVEAHLSHGDYEGECEVDQAGEGSDDEEDVESDDQDDEGDGEKVAVCHIPPGNPDNARTIHVDAEDVQDHLNHGDYEGECGSGTPGEDPGDGEESDEDPDEEKVLVCHVPPGNPTNARTISVGVSDLQDHLDHGDYAGECLE